MRFTRIFSHCLGQRQFTEKVHTNTFNAPRRLKQGRSLFDKAHRSLLDKAHFDSQLLPNENVLWSGQPDEATFRKEELRIGNFIAWGILAWSIAYGLTVAWQHGFSYSLSQQSLTIAGFVIAILFKLFLTFSRSNARYYWYAVTDKRILAEMPDEGGRTTLSINISDVRKLSLKPEKAEDETMRVGSVTITADTKKSKVIHLKHINHAGLVYGILEQTTLLEGLPT